MKTIDNGTIFVVPQIIARGTSFLELNGWVCSWGRMRHGKR